MMNFTPSVSTLGAGLELTNPEPEPSLASVREVVDEVDANRHRVLSHLVIRDMRQAIKDAGVQRLWKLGVEEIDACGKVGLCIAVLVAPAGMSIWRADLSQNLEALLVEVREFEADFPFVPVLDPLPPVVKDLAPHTQQPASAFVFS